MARNEVSPLKNVRDICQPFARPIYQPGHPKSGTQITLFNFVSLQLSQVYAHKNFVFEYMNSLTIIEEE